ALTSRLWKPNLSAVAGGSNAPMQLLVSVADAREERAARLGGADVIDAKNPRRGALGAVSEATLRAIGAEAGRPFSAALGDAGGVLLDTAYKDAALFALWSPEIVGAWVAAVQRAELFAALAGSLTARDVPLVRALGADLVGVRGAACVGGRLGRVTRARVAALSALARASAPLRAALA